MENEFDLSQLDEIKKLFEKIKKDAGFNDENSEFFEKTEFDDLIGMSPEEIYEMDKKAKENYKSVILDIKRINEEIVYPEYNYETDSGFDLRSTEDLVIPSLGRALVPTGLFFGIPDFAELQIRPKSGLALNLGLTVLNTPGTVDSGYNGEVKVILFNASDKEIKISKGMKIAQGIVAPVFSGKHVRLNYVNQIKEKDRNDSGFGSTGVF
jgi:dUTP pyrophosphatase